MNSSIGELEAALDPVSEEQHLQVIWQQLGVGGDGFLTLPQLGTVCDHIGMDEMNDEVRDLGNFGVGLPQIALEGIH